MVPEQFGGKMSEIGNQQMPQPEVGAANPRKEPKHIKSKIGQALLKHFTKKRTIH